MRRLRWVAVVVATMTIAAGCADSADPVDRVEVFGNYRGGDAELFAAVLADFEAETGIDTRYLGASGYSSVFDARVAGGTTPDVAMLPQPGKLAGLVARDQVVALPDEVAELVQGTVQDRMRLGFVDGDPYAVLFRIAVKSLVWYRPDVFAANGYEVPATLDELDTLVARMRADGFTPWCLTAEDFGSTGWLLSDWVEDLMLRRDGESVYDAVYGGDLSFSAPPFVSRLTELTELVQGGGVLGGLRRVFGIEVRDAHLPMFDAAPGCLLHRQGSFAEAWLPDGVEYGDGVSVFVLPGSDDEIPAPLLISGELAVAFDDRPEVMSLMRFLAGPDAAEAWETEGGFVSPHIEEDGPLRAGTLLEAYEQQLVSEDRVIRFDGSDVLPGAVGSQLMWDTLTKAVEGTVTPAGAAAILDQARADLEATTEISEASDGDDAAGGR